MLHFKIPDRPDPTDTLSFFGKKVKILMGLVKVAASGTLADSGPRLGHLYYFTKQNFIAIREEDEACRTVVQLLEIKAFDFDERKTMFKITLDKGHVYKFVFKIKEVSALFRSKITERIEALKKGKEELPVRSPGELKFFVGAFFESLVQDFHNQAFIPKAHYKNLIEGCWSRLMFDPKQLPQFLRYAPLKELENFLQKSDSFFDPHTFMALCRYQITSEDSTAKFGTSNSNIEANTLVVLTMSKPMYSVQPKGKALSSLYHKYLVPGKGLEHFRVNRVYFINRLPEKLDSSFSYWLLPLQ